MNLHSESARGCARATIFILILGACACNKHEQHEQHEQPAPASSAYAAPLPSGALPSPPAAATPTPAANPSPAARVTWADPSGFERKPAGGMRQATYVVPKAPGDSEPGELAVFYFGQGMGGSIDANLDRWAQQFAGVDPKQAKRDKRSVNGMLQHTIEIPSGTYASGMPGGDPTPKTRYGLLGAIVETPAGSYFFKLTGPSKTVAKARPKFFELLDSIKSS